MRSTCAVTVVAAWIAASTGCSSSTSGVERVAAGEGLTGGGASAEVTLAVQFAASGISTAAARADHDHPAYLTPTSLSSVGEAGSSALVSRSDHLHDARYAQLPVGSASVDPAQVQLRVSGACGAGTPIVAVNADGTVVCDGPRPRATYTHWGHATCAAGDDVLYTGLAFGTYYAHTGGATKPVCYAANDAGAAYNGANHGSYLVPLGLYHSGSDSAFQVQGLTGRRTIPCAVCATPRVCYEVVGSRSCAAGWTAAYQGELAGGYYAHSGNVDGFCYELNNAAALLPAADQAAVFAASTGAPANMVTGFTGYTHTKCALCCR